MKGALLFEWVYLHYYANILSFYPWHKLVSYDNIIHRNYFCNNISSNKSSHRDRPAVIHVGLMDTKLSVYLCD